MMNVVRVLSEKLRSSGPAPRAWIELPAARLPCAILAVLLPFALSGAIRAVTSLSLPLSLGLALLPCAALVWSFWPWLVATVGDMRRPGAWVGEIVVGAAVGLAIWALYIRDFGGFPNLDGWDGGSHVLIKEQFATIAPSIYNGQVAHHALAWWLETLLGLDSFRSFEAVFYLVTGGVVAIPLAVVLTCVREAADGKPVAYFVGLAVAFLGCVIVLWLVVLPLLHYNQAAGYYVHVFGLLPLVALWATDVLVRHQALRIALLLCGFVFLRYSYALNLADAALAVAFVLLVEGFRGRWRILQVLVLAGLVVGSWKIVSALRPVFQVWGGMQRFDVESVRWANLLLVISAAAYVLVSSGIGSQLAWLRSPLFRALRFPLAFALASAELLAVLREGKGVQYYYVTKYQIWACILLGFVLVVLASHLAVQLVQRSRLRKVSTWLCVSIAGVVLAWFPSAYSSAFIHYRTTLLERIQAHGPPYRHLHPLADTEAIARIERDLSTNGKQFGGYLTAFFPMFSFMNATLGHHLGRQEFFPPDTRPGHCVFWVTRNRDLFRLGPARRLDLLRAQVEAQGADGSATCVEYAVGWKTTPQSLCQRCY